LEVIQEEKLVENAAARGEQLKGALRAVADRHKQIADVRGLGLMIGNEFRDADGKPDGATASAVQQEAAKRGLLLLTCGAWGQVVRFIPALVVGEQDVDEAASMWGEAVDSVLG
jgi:4-aminobutyrate aminotransferase